MITKENAAKWLPLVHALADGKTVQRRKYRGGWEDSDCITDDNCGVLADPASGTEVV